MTPKARQKDVDLSMSIEPEARGVYRGDPARLREIILKLLGNTIKFTKKGGVSIQFNVKLAHAAAPEPALKRLCFELGASGTGVTQQVHEQLLNKFSQIDDAVTRRLDGTSLGFAIGKELVGLHAWRARRRRSIWRRAHLLVRIPLEISAAQVADFETLELHFKSLRVLVVDDIEMNLTIIGRQLATLGITASWRG